VVLPDDTNKASFTTSFTAKIPGRAFQSSLVQLNLSWFPPRHHLKPLQGAEVKLETSRFEGPAQLKPGPPLRPLKGAEVKL